MLQGIFGFDWPDQDTSIPPRKMIRSNRAIQ
jgi:hypothetical protein